MTSLICGKIALGNLLRADNEGPILNECVTRGLVPCGNPNKVNYSALRNLIKEQVCDNWMKANLGGNIPDAVGKTFRPLTTVDNFTVKYK